MGPKDGTMTAKNALNAVMGPKNGTMAALKSHGARLFPKGLSECQRGKRKGRPPEDLCTLARARGGPKGKAQPEPKPRLCLNAWEREPYRGAKCEAESLRIPI